MLHQLSILSTSVLVLSAMCGWIAHSLFGASAPEAFLVAGGVSLSVGVIGLLVSFEEIIDLEPVHVAGTSFACAGAAYIPYFLSWNLLFVLACLVVVGVAEWRRGRTFFGSMLAMTPGIATLFGIGLWAVERHNARRRGHWSTR